MSSQGTIISIPSLDSITSVSPIGTIISMSPISLIAKISSIFTITSIYHISMILWTDCIGSCKSCKSYYHTITTTMSPSMNNMVGVLSEVGTSYPSRVPRFTLGLWWGPCCSCF